MYFMQLMKKSN